MGKLIDVDDLLKELDGYIEYHIASYHDKATIESLVEAVPEAKADKLILLAPTKEGWIPTKKTQPEKCGSYLTWVDTEGMMVLVWVPPDENEKGGWSDVPSYKVLAWRPLPKSYRGEDKEG